MRILAKAVIYLVVIGVIGVLAYAIFSDLPAPSRPVELPATAK